MKWGDTWGLTYTGILCTVLQYYICVRTSLLNEWVIIYLEPGLNYILWFCLNLCLHFYLYGCLLYRCLCWQVDITAKWCLKCIFEHLDIYIWYSKWTICLFCVYIILTYLLYPEQMNCYSLFKILSLYICYLMFSDLCFYVHVFIFLTFILLSIKKQKQFLISEVPEPWYLVV